MRLAWLRPTPPDADNPLDDTAQLIRELAQRHVIDVFDARRAHDLVWLHERRAFDLFVYELDDTPGHQFVWPYVFHYPGLTILRNPTLGSTRIAALVNERRRADAARESAFDLGRPDAPMAGPMLRAPLVASRGSIVAHVTMAEALGARYPEARIAVVPAAVSAPLAPLPRHEGCAFGVIAIDECRDRLTVVRRAFQRAREAGASADARLDLRIDTDPVKVLAASDVVLALQWPTRGAPPVEAIAGMAAGRTVVVFDTAETADWPAIDPQTWRERHLFGSPAPICVSLDVRDEEHSLMLTMRRLSGDVALRQRLADAGETYWRGHHAPERLVPLFEKVLQETAPAMPPPRPSGWPAHLDADGSDRAREILSEMGVAVDFL